MVKNEFSIFSRRLLELLNLVFRNFLRVGSLATCRKRQCFITCCFWQDLYKSCRFWQVWIEHASIVKIKQTLKMQETKVLLQEFSHVDFECFVTSFHRTQRVIVGIVEQKPIDQFVSFVFGYTLFF